MSDKDTWKVGEKPPVGSILCCMTCNNSKSTVYIVTEGQKLEHCPVCGGILWYKV